MDIKLFVFDMAGTTVHDEDYVNLVFRKAMKSQDLDITRDEINEFMGYPKPYAIREVLKRRFGNDFATEQRVEELHTFFEKEMCDFYATSPDVREEANASEVFAFLRAKGIKVAIDTGFNRKIADIIFNRLGWVKNNLVDATITSDEVPNGRPHPDMIFALMKQFGITDAKQVAKVGDTTSDLEEGKNAGCGITIGVASGSYTIQQLVVSPHDYLFASIQEIKTLMGEE